MARSGLDWTKNRQDLGEAVKVANQNLHTIEYLLSQSKQQDGGAGDVNMIALNGQDADWMGSKGDESIHDREESICLD
jgi:hypothetical protein